MTPFYNRRGRALSAALVPLSYILLALLFTYPLALHLGSQVAGITGDSEEYLWSFWWMRKALLELHTDPFSTSWLYYPQGVSLRFFAFNPLHALLSIPLQQLFGLIAAYNLMALLTFVAAAYGTYLLAYDVTRSRAGSWLAGVLFAFAPTQVFHFGVGQPNLSAVELLPLYILCLRRWLAGGRPGWLLGSALTLTLNSLIDWQFAIYLQLFTAAALLHGLLEQRASWAAVLRSLAWRALALQALYVLCVLPLIIPMFRELSAPQPYMFRDFEDTASHSADLLAFLVPNPRHPLWGGWARPLLAAITDPHVLVTTVSLSYVMLALGSVAVLRNWRQSQFWLLCACSFLLLALGPDLRVAGRTVELPMPYDLLFQLPVIRISRTPARYAIVGVLCLCVLAALGVQALQKARGGITGPARRDKVDIRNAALLAGLAALLGFELLPAPIVLERPAPAPAFFTDGSLERAGALLEQPNPSKRGMYFATLHERPVLYGELSRDNPAGSELQHLREGLFEDMGDDIIDPLANWHCNAHHRDISHLVVYAPQPGQPPIDPQLLRARLGTAALVSATAEATLYRLPDVPDGQTCVLFGEGWDRPRRLSNDGPTYRWTSQQAQVGLLRRTPGRVTLQFSTHSFAIPRTMQVRQGQQVLAEFPVDGSPTPHAVTLDLPAGMTWLELASLEPATAPSDYGYDETRPIAIGISGLHIEARD